MVKVGVTLAFDAATSLISVQLLVEQSGGRFQQWLVGGPFLATLHIIVAQRTIAFSERAGLPSSVSVQKALQHVEATQRASTKSQAELQKLDKKIAALAAQGITFAVLQKVASQLRALHYAVELSGPVVQALLQEIEQSIDASNT